MDLNHQLLDFIAASPTAFHDVAQVTARLEKNGYAKLRTAEDWQIQHGGKYYLTANDSSLIAFHIPEGDAQGFMLSATHSDSPTFKLKPAPQRTTGQYVQLNTERYGGMLLSSWLDRPLGIAGRVLVEEDGRVVSHLVYPDRDLAIIPSVAIHVNRTANDGFKHNPAVDLIPLCGTAQSSNDLLPLLAESAGVDPSAVLEHDLYLVCRDRGTVFGTANDLLSAPRLDDLACVFGCLQGFLRAEEGNAIDVLCVFDNEETGSETKQGAASTWLRDTLRRITAALNMDEAQYQQLLCRSFMVSADNAHALHPNHPELSDKENSPVLNGGIVIKYNANQRYTTDAVSAALLRTVCRSANIPVQSFSNRSDMAGGSTLGSIANTHVPVRTVDIGLPQLAMHSAYETMGSADLAHLIHLIATLYGKTVHTADDGAQHLA